MASNGTPCFSGLGLATTIVLLIGGSIQALAALTVIEKFIFERH